MCASPGRRPADHHAGKDREYDVHADDGEIHGREVHRGRHVYPHDDDDDGATSRRITTALLLLLLLAKTANTRRGGRLFFIYPSYERALACSVEACVARGFRRRSGSLRGRRSSDRVEDQSRALDCCCDAEDDTA